MKREIQIKRQSDSTYLTELVLMHQKIFEGTQLYGKLIYFDGAFPNYFKSVLSNNDNYVFGIFIKNKIYGFVHFRKIDNILFLNNIFLSEMIRGNGTGTDVLNQALNMPFVSENNFTQIQLDVLGSNSIAKRWYEKIGFFQEYLESWYYVNRTDVNVNVDLKLSFDNNRFESLYLNESKVATVIQKSCVIVHDFRALGFLSELPIILKTKEGIIENNFQFVQFDTSIRMIGEIATILKNTNNA